MSAVKFRPRRGNLARSLEETVEVESRKQLLAAVQDFLGDFREEAGTVDDLAVIYEGHPKAEWDAYEVWFLGTLVGYASGPVGRG